MPDETPPVHHVPMTEEEIHAARIGPPTLLNRPIRLVEYDPEWPRLFQREADRIRRALGERALLVEHTGSTSVPGLAAKPIVDILLVVPDSSDEPSYVPAMEAAGYLLRIREPDWWFQHRLFKGRHRRHRLLGRLRGDRAHPALPRPPAPDADRALKRPSVSRSALLEVHPELRRRQDRRRRGDHRASTRSPACPSTTPSPSR